MIRFSVPGIAQPGGSKRAFFNKKTGRAMVVETCKKNPEWRSRVALCAREAYNGALITGPVQLTVNFYFPRPNSHYGTGKNADTLKASAPICHVIKPDTTKLLRALEDALTGVVWKDDSQVVYQTASKGYAENPRADVIIEALT